MKNDEDYLLAYARKDSQRLKETFFTKEKEKGSRDNFIMVALIGAIVLFAIAGIILVRYDLF